MTIRSFTVPLAAVVLFVGERALGAQEHSPLRAAWVPGNGDGTYSNPIIFADYSDPDVIRVGDDFYLVSPSFDCVPGLPVLHSRDLVNWEIIGHVFDRLPSSVFENPQHGKGCWAPSIRSHDDHFWVFQGGSRSRDLHVKDEGVQVERAPLFMRVDVDTDAVCLFRYSTDGTTFEEFGKPFKAREGVWIGAKVGLFSTASRRADIAGYADFQWFRMGVLGGQN